MSKMNVVNKNQKLFSILKPVCDNVITKPSQKNLQDLKTTLENVSSMQIQTFQEYIIFPLVVHLQNKDFGYNENLRRELVQAITKVLEITQVRNEKVFFKIYSVLISQIYEKTSLVASIHEEFKLAIINCLTILVQNLSVDIVEEIYQKSKSPRLGIGVYLCVKIAQKEKWKTLKLAAIECITSFAFIHDEADKTDIVLRSQVSDVFIFFLPGVASGLQEVALASDIQGHEVTMNALKAWGEIVALVLEDQSVLDEPSLMDLTSLLSVGQKSTKNIKKQPKIKPTDPEKLIEHLNSVEKTPEWFSETIEKFEILVKGLRELENHSHWKVRRQLAYTCDIMLKRCSRNLKSLNRYFIEMLITLSEDDNEAVRNAAKDALNAFSEKCSKISNKPIREMLEENFYKLLTSLPRLMSSFDEKKQSSALSLLAGYLRLLKSNNFYNVLCSASHLEHLTTALVFISELTYDDISLLEEYTLRDFETVADLGTPWSQFRFLQNEHMISKLKVICKYLGQSDASYILIDHLLDMFNNEIMDRKEIIFILNEVLSAESDNLTDKIHLVKNVLEVYLEPENWYVSLNTDHEYKTPAEVKNNLVTACLLVEGIGKFAKCLQNEFQQFLLKTLYFVLERVGSTQPLLSAAGTLATRDICSSVNAVDATDLLKTNADYFSYHVIMKLRRVENNPGVLDVLAVVMRNCSVAVLPCLKDIVGDVLVQSCDIFQKHNATAFLRVFNTFVMCINRWQNENPKENVKPLKNEETLHPENSGTTLSELNEILEESDIYEKNLMEKTIEEMYEEDLQEQTKLNNESCYDSQETEKIEPPIEILLTVSVMKRCLHFLPSKDRNRKLLVLKTLKEGIFVIKDWEDELLPLVHQIWSPLVDRFKETSDPLIMHQSLLLLHALAETSKDFIRMRTCQQVLPVICDWLYKSASQSRLQDRGAAYRYTQAYKLQIALLEYLGQIIVHLDVSDENFIIVLKSAHPFLSDKQPLPLQASCINLYKMLIENNVQLVKRHLDSYDNETKNYSDFIKNTKQVNDFLISKTKK